MTQTAFVYSDRLSEFDYGRGHPLKPFRLKLTCELIKAYGLLDLPQTHFVEALPAGEEDLLLFHEREYLEVLKGVNGGIEVPSSYRYGLGFGDNPVFRGVYDWSALVTGASLQAAALVDDGEVAVAFNIAGGLHHALASRASGFCYVNDAVVAIKSLLKRGRRVAYIDIDAHHGDGVQAAFYETDKVLTVSIHETGMLLFPGTGFENETGRGKGQGHSVNIPMPPSSDDELFVYAFNEVVPPRLGRFGPDIVVTQLGVDSFRSDPLTHLNYTTNGFCEVVKKIGEIAPKWVALGGGGYDIANVARAWTLAWAIMNHIDIPDEIPKDFLNRHRHEGFSSGRIRDDVYREEGSRKEKMMAEVKRVVDAVKKSAF